jgi:chemotaxis protein MotB
MALTSRRRGGDNGLSAWPGFVDALSTLLMVIIFVLLVFVLAQAFLSVALSGRDKQLDRVNRQLAEVSDMLSLERSHGSDLQQSIDQLSRELSASNAVRSSLADQVGALKTQAERAGADRDSLRADRDRLAQQLADAGLQAQSNAARVDQLQKDVAVSAAQADAARQEVAQLTTQLADMRKQAAELDKTVQVGKDTITARLSDLAKLAEQNRALAALRDDLEKQAQDAAVRATTEAQRRAAVAIELAKEKTLGDSATAQIALLNQQVDQLKAQLTSVAQALDVAKSQSVSKDTEIANLGQKLNVALAQRVEELKGYRSEFFGKLREVLANRPGIQVVGDRFVIQSEVLFPLGSADLKPAGQNEITALAVTIKNIAVEIPPGVQWILRVDGHTDRQPIKGAFGYASNWELSVARAITVVKLLIADGVPPEHLAAAGFADYQPLDQGDTPEAYAKNRRIELRLTDR